MGAHSKLPQVVGYDLEKQIGSGSSGVVYRAKDQNTGRLVVIKRINTTNVWLRREYEREVTNLARLNHPGIIKLVDHSETKNYGQIVLECMQGDLLDLIEAGQPSVEEAKEIFVQICHSVAYIHSRHLAHLDIKPENIFINSKNRVKLGDFGSSSFWKPGEPIVRFGQLGTRFYCAPEVRPNLEFHPGKADIWSLGILLYVLLTGYWPFSGSDQETLQNNIDKGVTSFLHQSLPGGRVDGFAEK